MILSDRELKAAVARGAVRITPQPSDEAWSSTALDLHLSKDLLVWKRPSGGGTKTVICPSHEDFDFDDLKRRFSEKAVIQADGHVFKSGNFLLGWTTETICLPHQSRIAARVEGKSSLARLGIGVHVTAPTIHAGFGFKPGMDHFSWNPLQLELWNVGPLDILLEVGMAICQVIFELVDGTPEKGYEGRFSIQGPTI